MATLNRTRIANANMARCGEPITLTGAVELTAIVQVNNPLGFGLGAGFESQLEAGAQTALMVTEAVFAEHGAALAVGQLVGLRGDWYRITEPGDPDGYGLVRLPLMPSTEPD